METIDLMKEGFRRATSHDEKVFEAADLFYRGRKAWNPMAQAVLLEAFSTSDFPVLLGNAFEKKAIAAQKAAVFEFDQIVAHTTRPDLTRGKLVDLWSNDEFERVNEGEEYKGGTLNETELEHGTAKYGKSYGLTFELRLRRMFSELAKWPQFLGNGATRARNSGVASTLVTDAGAWDPALFGTVENTLLDADGLKAALRTLSLREDHRGDLVDTSDLVLVVGPALAEQARQLTTVAEVVTKKTSGNTVTEVRQQNPFNGRVSVLESRTIGKRLGDNQSTAWAIVQGKSSTLPSIIETGLEGHDGNVDIRVQRDQGQTVGGGDIPVEEGSFKDDTIWFRGRTFFDFDRGFGQGVYASTGTGA